MFFIDPRANFDDPNYVNKDEIVMDPNIKYTYIRKKDWLDYVDATTEFFTMVFTDITIIVSFVYRLGLWLVLTNIVAM